MTGSARVSIHLALCAVFPAAAALQRSAQDVAANPLQQVVIIMQETQNEIALTEEKFRASASRHALVSLLLARARDSPFALRVFPPLCCGLLYRRTRERERERERENTHRPPRERGKLPALGRSVPVGGLRARASAISVEARELVMYSGLRIMRSG